MKICTTRGIILDLDKVLYHQVIGGPNIYQIECYTDEYQYPYEEGPIKHLTKEERLKEQFEYEEKFKELQAKNHHVLCGKYDTLKEARTRARELF